MIRSKQILALLTLAFSSLALIGCPSSDSVKIGAVLPLTGDAAVYGTSIQKGVELGFEVLNADESLQYKVELDLRDSGGDPARAAQLTDELDQEDVAIIGGVTSDEAAAMAEVVKNSEKLLISPSASSARLARSAKTFFRLFITTIVEGSAMANFADETLKIESVAILQEQSAFGEDLTASFSKAFEAGGGTITATLPIGDGGYEDLVAEALATEPAAVYVVASGEATPKIIVALRDAGFSEQGQYILSTSAFGTPALIEQAGEAANSVYIVMSQYDVDSDNPGVRTFVDAYRAKYNEDPDIYAAHGYDSMLLVGEALKMTLNTLPSEVLKGLRSIDPLQGATGTLQFNESGDAQKFARAHWIEDGVAHDFQELMKERQEALRKKMDDLRREAEKLRRDTAD